MKTFHLYLAYLNTIFLLVLPILAIIVILTGNGLKVLLVCLVCYATSLIWWVIIREVLKNGK